MAKAVEKEEKELEIPDSLPVLPIRDIVVFPYMILPLFVGREMSIKAIEYSLSTNKMIMLIAQKDLNAENPSPSGLYHVGTVGLIMRMLKLPDGRVKVLVQGLSKAKAVKFLKEEPFFTASIEKITDTPPEEITIEIEAVMRTVKEQIDKTVSLGKTILPDIMIVIENLEDPGKLADLIASNIGLKTEQAQEVLEITEPVQRLKKVSEILNREIELLTVQQKIQTEVRAR